MLFIYLFICIFIGPGVSSPFGFRCLYPITQTSIAVTLTSILASMDPSGIAAPLLQSEITSDEKELMKLKNDKRMGPSNVSNKSAYEILKLVADAKVELSNVKVPFLVIHGDIDQISLIEGGQYLYDNAGSSSNKKQIIVIANGKHELLHEVTEIKSVAMIAIVNYFENQFNSIKKE